MDKNSRIFYLNTQQLAVYQWNGKELDFLNSYDSTPAGQTAFSRYLSSEPDVVSSVLVDVVEEEYRNETIPHVLGRDKNAVRDRKLAQMFRHTSYRTCQIQGREKTGRKDDRALLTALTNPGMVSYWLAYIRAANVPLAGIYSLPMLGSQLFRKLNIKCAHALLITEQSNSVLRQSFHSDGHLKISRLSPVTDDNRNNYTAFLIAEIEKNQRYLNRLRILPFDKVLDVYVVCEQSRIEQLQQECEDSKSTHYHFIDINEAAHQIGLQQELNSAHSEPLFIRLLAGERPATNYASTDERRYHLMYQARKAMVAIGVVAAISSSIWSVQNVTEGLKYNALRAEVIQQAKILEIDQQQLSMQLPNTPKRPRDMQAAVETYRLLQEHTTTPYLTMSALGKQLQYFPGLQLEEIQWLSSFDVDREIGQPVLDTDSEDMSGEEQQDNAEESPQLYQIALFKGYVKSFNGDYPAAFSMVNSLMENLRKDPRFVKVIANAMPLDVNSQSTLKGVSGAAEQIVPAKFEIKTVLRVDHGKV